MVKLRRKNYVTPKHYLDFINNYLKLLDEKDEYIVAQVKSKELIIKNTILVIIFIA